MRLLDLTLTLRPLEGGPAPQVSGAAAQRLLLDMLGDSEAGQQAQQRGPAGGPYTVSPLLGEARGLPLDPDAQYGLRFTGITIGLANALEQAATTGPWSEGREISLGSVPFMIEQVDLDAVEYQELAAPWLLGAARPPLRFGLRLASPATFQDGPRHLPVPLPGLLFAGLLARWNAFAPLTLPAEVSQFAATALQIGSYRLATRRVLPQDGGIFQGAEGVVRYTCLQPDRYSLSICALLLGFARFAGVGVGTELGMGQCRPLESQENPS